MDQILEKFIFAISRNNIEAVKAFLRPDNVNIRLECICPHLLHCNQLLRPYDSDSTGEYYKSEHWFNITPLMYAAAFHSAEAVEMLLETGADVTAEDSIGMTALGFAILGGSEKIAMLLLDRGAAVNSATHWADLSQRPDKDQSPGNKLTIRGVTPLHLAAKANFSGLVMALMDKGANPQAVDDMNRTPLQIAVKSGCLQAMAVMQKQIPAIQIPQEHGEAIGLLDAYLHCGRNHEELRQLVELVINDNYRLAVVGPGYSTEYNEMTLWKFGCMRKKSLALRYLLENGFYTTARDYPRPGFRRDGNPLAVAVGYGLSDLALMLINGKHYTPVQSDMADAARNLPLLTACLKFGLSLKPYEENGRPINPLMENLFPAAQDDDKLVLYDFMLKQGALFEMHYRGNCKTLEAAANNNAKLLQLLHKNGVDVTMADQTGTTPLMKAASMGQLDALSFLVKFKNKLDQRNARGQTALLQAVNYSKTDAAKMLLEAGASLKLTDMTGVTVLALAEKRKLAGLVDFIRKRSSDGLG